MLPIHLIQKPDGKIVLSREEYNKYLDRCNGNVEEANNLLAKFLMEEVALTNKGVQTSQGIKTTVSNAKEVVGAETKVASTIDKAGAEVVEGPGKAVSGLRSPGTLIDRQVKVTQQAELPSWVKDSFKGRAYTTVETTEDIVLYRTFGGRADAGGGFATTVTTANRMQATENLALLPEWGNSRMYEAAIKIPKGTTLNVGKVAEQTTQTGNVLAGGADQVLLPQNWPLEWIKEIRTIPSK